MKLFDISHLVDKKHNDIDFLGTTYTPALYLMAVDYKQIPNKASKLFLHVKANSNRAANQTLNSHHYSHCALHCSVVYFGNTYTSLLAEVSHDEAKMRERRETSAGFRRVV